VLTALGLLGPGLRDEVAAGVTLAEDAIGLAVVDRHAVLCAHHRPREPGQGALDRWEATLAGVERMWRLVKMEYPELVVSRARAVVNEQDAALAETLQARLGVPVEVLAAGGALPVAVEGRAAMPAAQYAAAVGLALEGLAGQPQAAARGKRGAARSFNFLRPATAPAPRRRLGRKGLAVAAAAVLAAAAVAAGAYTWHKHDVLSDLRARHAQVAGRLKRHKELRQQWRALQRWVAPQRDGQRVAYRDLFDEISNLYPDTAQAQIASLTAGTDPAAGGTVIRLDGRASGTDVLYAFLARLNDSTTFDRAALGSVTDEAGETEFPKRFTITVHLKGGR